MITSILKITVILDPTNNRSWDNHIRLSTIGGDWCDQHVIFASHWIQQIMGAENHVARSPLSARKVSVDGGLLMVSTVRDTRTAVSGCPRSGGLAVESRKRAGIPESTLV